MNSPIYDASVAGCLANATLCAPAPDEAPPRRDPAPFAASPRGESAGPQAAPCRVGWRRLLDALVSLVSGPTLERSPTV